MSHSVLKIAKMVWREVLHRKASSLLAFVSVVVATGCLTAAIALLRADAVNTTRILALKQEAVREAADELEDAMRVITKELGFNILILPHDQDLSELHLEGTLSKSMPEGYCERLAASGIMTVNHLLPSVVKKLTWPEKGLPIVLQGTRGEVPLLHSDPKQPLLDAVPRNRMVLGYQVHRRSEAAVGDQVMLLSKEFTILKVHDERGNVDDMTVWIHLADAQELLGMDNLIHAILALECHCAGDRITAIREDVCSILPGTQVIERGPPALARAEARNQAKESALFALELETATRAKLRLQREHFASFLLPLLLLGAAVWIGFLAYGNVRERRSELAILHALGFRRGEILALFLGKSALIGLVGGLSGAAIGWLTGWATAVDFSAPGSEWTSSPLYLLGLGLVVAILLSAVGSWLPALWAARQDPAELLRES